jgi:3-deoxy-D-manno-octulosonic-acid transferase
MHNFRDMVALLTAHGALTVCPTPATLADALLPLLTNPAAHAAAVARLTPALDGMTGATDRVATALLSTLTEVTHGAA